MESITKVIKNQVRFSRHSQKRLDQRGISPSVVCSVLQQGKTIHKQRLKFFYVPRQDAQAIEKDMREAVANLIVVTNLDQTEIITCYKNAKAIHRIKKKPKRLSK